MTPDEGRIMIDGMAPLLARMATEHYVNSARPHAPVVPARPGRALQSRTSDRSGRVARVRSAVAGMLHRVADAVAPQCPPRAAAH